MSNASPASPQPPSASEFELTLLKEEYFFLQQTIEDYNKQIWVIKALGITATGATIAFTLKQQQNAIALIGCAIPLFFWILESQWKHFQRGFYPRVDEIEAILKDCSLRSPKIFGGWCDAFKRKSASRRKGYLLSLERFAQSQCVHQLCSGDWVSGCRVFD